MKSIDGAATQTKQDPDYVLNQLKEAWDYVREEQFQEANKAFTDVFRLDAANWEALYGQALCLRKLGNKDEARSKLKEVCALDPTYARFLEKEALMSIEKEQYDEAIEPFVEANDKDALQRMIVSLRTWRHLEVKKEIQEVGKIIEKVEKIIAAALRKFPDDPGFRSESGWVYYTHEQYDKAIEKFDEVLQDTSLFRLGDELADPAELIVKLLNSQDAVSQYLLRRFTPETQRLMEEYADRKE